MKKRLVIDGGPNGCGKSTVAYQYAKESLLDYLGADDIAAQLAKSGERVSEVQADKEFFRRLEAHTRERKSLIIESTLSGRSLLSKIGPLRKAGYRIELIYVFLDSPSFCRNRISIRVKKGGHHVPFADVARRFPRSLSNFWDLYRPFCDRWTLVYNGGTRPVEVAVHDAGETVVLDDEYFNVFNKLLEGT